MDSWLVRKKVQIGLSFFLIKKKNYKNIQINKVKEIFQNKEDKNMQTRKGRHEISWWNRILFHRIHQ